MLNSSQMATARRTDGGPGGIPEPPWWEPRQGRGTRAREPLSREAIVDAALRVLDEGGLDALTMRAVAKKLNTGAASLYWHVANKDQLLDLVIDRVAGEIPLPQPDPEHWQEQTKQFGRDARRAFLRYRDVARASMGRIPVGPNLVRIMEWQLTLFTRAGLPPRPAAWFGDIGALYVAAHAMEDQVAGDASEPPDVAGMLESYFASLPREQFPALTAMAPVLMSGSAEERFEFGLELIVLGLEAMAARER